jgi:hypothetical protein
MNFQPVVLRHCWVSFVIGRLRCCRHGDQRGTGASQGNEVPLSRARHAHGVHSLGKYIHNLTIYGI